MIYALVLYSGPKYCLEHERGSGAPAPQSPRPRHKHTHSQPEIGSVEARRQKTRWRSHHGTVSAPDRRLGWGRCGNPTGRTTRSSLIAGFHAMRIAPQIRRAGFESCLKPLGRALALAMVHLSPGHAESFLNKHVAIFFLGKCRFAAGTALCAGLLLK
jgi:hypothetical protein